MTGPLRDELTPLFTLTGILLARRRQAEPEFREMVHRLAAEKINVSETLAQVIRRAKADPPKESTPDPDRGDTEARRPATYWIPPACDSVADVVELPESDQE